jgi:methylase of polypeptide subunit release factors
MDEISNKNSYDKIIFQWANDREKSFVSTLVIEFASKEKPGGRILDLGCGSGIPNAAYLCDKGFSLIDIDAPKK